MLIAIHMKQNQAYTRQSNHNAISTIIILLFCERSHLQHAVNVKRHDSTRNN